MATTNGAVKTTYVLIDYENVQPKDLERLNGHPVNVVVFLGDKQAKISAELAEALQTRGERGRYLRISGNGRNALDFHIAFHLGQIATEDPKGLFVVVTKDKGFDPLIDYLRSKKFDVQRLSDLAEIKAPAGDKLEIIIKNLSARGQARPRRRKTLVSTIKSLFHEIQQSEVDALVDELERRRHIRIEGDRVGYDLPDAAEGR